MPCSRTVKGKDNGGALDEEARGRSGKVQEGTRQVDPYFSKEEQCGEERDENELQGDVDRAVIGAGVACPGTGECMSCRFIWLMMVLMVSRLVRGGLDGRPRACAGEKSDDRIQQDARQRQRAHDVVTEPPREGVQ